MRPYTCEQVWTLASKASDVFTVDFTDALADGETLSAISGSVVIAGITYALGVTVPAWLIAGTPTINSGEVTSDGETIEASKAVQVRLSTNGATVGRVASVIVTASTSGGNVLPVECKLEVIG